MAFSEDSLNRYRTKSRCSARHHDSGHMRLSKRLAIQPIMSWAQVRLLTELRPSFYRLGERRRYRRDLFGHGQQHHCRDHRP